jgi:valyl-tRNA synthetase
MKQMELSKVYEPREVEERIYGTWLKEDLFDAKPDPLRKPYCIVIPPPNITGSLHMGHALDNTIQDLLIRWKRMAGYSSLWIPGTDHAGIATQTVVEKDLAREEKVTRHDLGREKFIERVWKWAKEYKQYIAHQLKTMGVSCDWKRERFTLDEVCSTAVRRAFVSLYEEGLIYRGRYIINWCPRCLTALSDLEVEHEETQGKLYYLRYPLEGGEGAVTIATTRPETILADTAVAVHPEDERYRSYMGKKVILPIVGRLLPVIADEVVEPAFGTGALKITPAHDPNDFQAGLRHDLPVIVVIDEHGVMNAEAGEAYAGLDRFACRRKILEVLEKGGFVEKIEDYTHGVGTCYRCRTIVEPHLSWQWFVKMKELAEPAIEVVKKGRVRFIPERYEKTYLYWMENIKDWCISRQLWWGHRIPVWTCGSCGLEKAFIDDPVSCPKCGSRELRQEEDVLDTWFSSGLWPLSTLGWPQETEDLKYFYPTSVLVTARDIIFLWVARMIMMGLKFRNEVPFRDVFIHATILTRDGHRMSKSKGTGIDPMELFQKYGVDATRYGLIYMTAQGQDIRYAEERLEMSRNFINKIWNATRLVLRFLEHTPQYRPWKELTLSLPDRWILSRVTNLVEEAEKALEEYRLDHYSQMLYSFFWDDFCDWYVEIVKPAFYDRSDAKEQAAVRQVLHYALTTFLKILHPVAPFVTEELWGFLPHGEESARPGTIMCGPWPSIMEELKDPTAEERMALLSSILRGIRNLRAEVSIAPKTEAEVILEAPNPGNLDLLRSNASILEGLAKARPLSFHGKIEERPKNALSSRIGEVEIFLPLAGLVDIPKEIERLKKELASLEKELENVNRKLSRDDFIGKAPEPVVEKARARAEDLANLREKITGRLILLSGMAS